MPVSLTSSTAESSVAAQPAHDAAAVGGELHRVAEQVHHHAVEVAGVAEDDDLVPGDVEVHAEVPAGQQRVDGLARRGRPRWPRSTGSRRPGGAVARLEPGQGEQVAGDRDQPVAVAGDRVQHHLLPGGDRAGGALAQHLGVADDAGGRRPQLVADGGDEVVLGRVEPAEPLDDVALLVQRRDQQAPGCGAAR